jgi:hypothetical protein
VGLGAANNAATLVRAAGSTSRGAAPSRLGWYALDNTANAEAALEKDMAMIGGEELFTRVRHHGTTPPDAAANAALPAGTPFIDKMYATMLSYTALPNDPAFAGGIVRAFSNNVPTAFPDHAS